MPRSRSSTEVDDLIERILVDAYGDGEGMAAFFEAFDAEVPFPRDAFVAGQPVTVQRVDYDGNVRRGLVAVCEAEDGASHRLSLADVFFPASSEACLHVAAYRKWIGLPESPPPARSAKPTRRHKSKP